MQIQNSQKPQNSNTILNAATGFLDKSSNSH